MALSSEKAFLTLLVGHTQSKRFLIVTISFQQNAKIPQKQSFSGRLCGIECKKLHLHAFFWKTGKGLPFAKIQLGNTVLYISHRYGLPSVDFCGCEPLPPLSCPVRDRYAGGFCTQYKEKGRKKQGEFSEITEGLYLCCFAQTILPTFDQTVQVKLSFGSGNSDLQEKKKNPAESNCLFFFFLLS